MKESEKKAIASLTMAGMASLALGTGPIGILVATGAAIFPIAKWHLFSNLPEEIIDSLPDDVKLYLPTVSLALDQMKKDIERSPLLSPALLSTKEKAVQDELGVLDPKENMTPKEHVIERLFAGRIWGIPSDEDVALLREMCSGPEALRVECQSVCVGAYAAFVSMRKRHAVEFEIDPSAASGVETAVTQSHRDDDILVTADAPMILGKSRFSFQKVV